MRIVHITLLASLACLPALADFSYTTTQKSTGGMMAAMVAANGANVTKTALKGQKMKIDTSASTIIIDFDAQTVTTLNKASKTYGVRNFSDVPPQASGAGAAIDAKETGQHKNINGFDATEWVLNAELDMSQMSGGRGAALGRMQMEVDLWVSTQVPGADEVRAFHQRNAGKFPWTAMAGGRGNPGMSAAISDLQKKLATMNGIPVEQVIRVKSAGGGAMPAGPSPDQMARMKAGMAQACAQLAPMLEKGGPAAAMIKQQYDRMGCGNTGSTAAPGGAGSGALIEMTMDSSDFSTASIPASDFEIPGDYKKTN